MYVCRLHIIIYIHCITRLRWKLFNLTPFSRFVTIMSVTKRGEWKLRQRIEPVRKGGGPKSAVVTWHNKQTALRKFNVIKGPEQNVTKISFLCYVFGFWKQKYVTFSACILSHIRSYIIENLNVSRHRRTLMVILLIQGFVDPHRGDISFLGGLHQKIKS